MKRCNETQKKIAPRIVREDETSLNSTKAKKGLKAITYTHERRNYFFYKVD